MDIKGISCIATLGLLGLLVFLIYSWKSQEDQSESTNQNAAVKRQDENLGNNEKGLRVRERNAQSKLEKIRDAFAKTNYERHKPEPIQIKSTTRLKKIKESLNKIDLRTRTESTPVADVHEALSAMATIVRLPFREANPHSYFDNGGWIYIWGGESDTPTHGYAVEKAKGKFYKWHLYKEKEAKRLLSGDSSYFFPLESEK